MWKTVPWKTTFLHELGVELHFHVSQSVHCTLVVESIAFEDFWRSFYPRRWMLLGVFRLSREKSQELQHTETVEMVYVTKIGSG